VHGAMKRRLALLLHGRTANGTVVNEIPAALEDLAELKEGRGIGRELVALFWGDCGSVKLH